MSTEENKPGYHAMALVRRTVCRYKCGECDYEGVFPWEIHQQHYEFHRIEKSLR